MFFVHSTRKECNSSVTTTTKPLSKCLGVLSIAINWRHNIKDLKRATLTDHFELNLRLRKTRSGKSGYYRDVIVFENLRFQIGRVPFDQNFQKFRSKIEWNRHFPEIRLVHPQGAHNLTE